MKLYALIDTSHVNTPDRIIPGSVPLSGSSPKVDGVCSGPRHTVRLTLWKYVQLCNPADKPANQQTNVNREETENREHNLLGVKIQLALAH